jgi:hypothetical protein
MLWSSGGGLDEVVGQLVYIGARSWKNSVSNRCVVQLREDGREGMV